MTNKPTFKRDFRPDRSDVLGLIGCVAMFLAIVGVFALFGGSR